MDLEHFSKLLMEMLEFQKEMQKESEGLRRAIDSLNVASSDLQSEAKSLHDLGIEVREAAGSVQKEVIEFTKEYTDVFESLEHTGKELSEISKYQMENLKWLEIMAKQPQIDGVDTMQDNYQGDTVFNTFDKQDNNS